MDSLFLTHRVLYEKQQKKGSWLTSKELEVILQTTPGILFAPRTTYEDVYELLEHYKLLLRDTNKKGETKFLILSGGYL
jgi:hypothetical protein